MAFTLLPRKWQSVTGGKRTRLVELALLEVLVEDAGICGAGSRDGEDGR
jgi:hypothetical protein